MLHPLRSRVLRKVGRGVLIKAPSVLKTLGLVEGDDLVVLGAQSRSGVSEQMSETHSTGPTYCCGGLFTDLGVTLGASRKYWFLVDWDLDGFT